MDKLTIKLQDFLMHVYAKERGVDPPLNVRDWATQEGLVEDECESKARAFNQSTSWSPDEDNMTKRYVEFATGGGRSSSDEDIVRTLSRSAAILRSPGALVDHVRRHRTIAEVNEISRKESVSTDAGEQKEITRFITGGDGNRGQGAGSRVDDRDGDTWMASWPTTNDEDNVDTNRGEHTSVWDPQTVTASPIAAGCSLGENSPTLILSRSSSQAAPTAVPGGLLPLPGNSTPVPAARSREPLDLRSPPVSPFSAASSWSTGPDVADVANANAIAAGAAVGPRDWPLNNPSQASYRQAWPGYSPMHQLAQGWIPYIIEDTILLTSEPNRLVYVEDIDIHDKPGAGFYVFENRVGSILLPKHRLAEELHILPFIVTAAGDPRGSDPRPVNIPGAIQSFDHRSGALVSAGFLAGDVITRINGNETTRAYIKYVHEEAYSSVVAYRQRREVSIVRLRLSIIRCTGENRFNVRPQELVESWLRITRSVYLSAVQEGEHKRSLLRIDADMATQEALRALASQEFSEYEKQNAVYTTRAHGRDQNNAGGAGSSTHHAAGPTQSMAMERHLVAPSPHQGSDAQHY